jgi:hypothetical protein
MEENNEVELKWRKKFTEQRDNFITHKTHKIDINAIKSREEENKSPAFKKQTPEVQDLILEQKRTIQNYERKIKDLTINLDNNKMELNSKNY